MTKPKSLSKDEVLQAIQSWIAHHGFPPTIEELRRVLNVGSKRTVLRYLAWLEEEGDIQRWPGARGLKPLRASQERIETRMVPLVGEVPAGPLMLAEENREGWVQLPKDLLTPQSAEYFLLRVRGDSMNRALVHGANIEDGDLVAVRRQPTAEPGQIIVALVDGEATIKRLVKGPGYYMLKPESSKTYTPIILTEEFQIQGIVTRVLKKGADLIR